MSTFLLVIFLACYYYLWVYRGRAVERPGSAEPRPPALLFAYYVKSRGGGKASLWTSDGKEWIVPALVDYRYDADNDLVERDACHGRNDGVKVPAAGKALYEFVQRERRAQVVMDRPARLMRNGKRFYFGCRGEKIEDLHVCGPGEVFHRWNCTPILPCTGREDGTRYRDEQDPRRFHECRDERPHHYTCPDGQYFVSDSCRKPYDAGSGETFAIDLRRYVKDVDGRRTVLRCPAGTRYRNGRCESDLCGGARGAKVPLPRVRDDPFVYSPGYATCDAEGRVAEEKTCDRQWDAGLATERLHGLPMVFDGTACAVPRLCENVEAPDPETVVPSYEFARELGDWSNARFFDASSGVRCVGGRRTEVSVAPGNAIVQFREASGCGDPAGRVVLAGRTDAYHDCETGETVECAAGSYFDGEECRERRPHAHRWRDGVETFAYGGLSDVNGWIRPFPYAAIQNDVQCEAGEKRLLGYNVCAEEGCGLYPFLCQVKFGILLASAKGEDSHVCVFVDDKIRRRENLHAKSKEFRVDFWRQRLVPEEEPDGGDPCVPGQRTFSGLFQIDSSLYATCDDAQPFVFCPSPHTKGIAKTKGSKKNYACLPRDAVYEGVLPAGRHIDVYKEELDRFVPADGATYAAGVSQSVYDAAAHPNGVEIDGFSKDHVRLSSDKDMKLFFKKLSTYPINSYATKSGVNALNDNTYIVKGNGTTGLNVGVVEHWTID